MNKIDNNHCFKYFFCEIGKSLSWISKFKDFDQFISNDVKKLTQQFPDVINKIKQFYFADKIICKETFHSIIDVSYNKKKIMFVIILF